MNRAKTLIGCPNNPQKRKGQLVTTAREDYTKLLKSLPISSPKRKDFVKLCPHLNKAEIKVILEGAGRKDVLFAVPSILIKHSYHVLRYRDAHTDRAGKRHPARIEYGFAVRTAASYIDNRLHGDLLHSTMHQKRAMEYAEKNWGEALIIDDWSCILKVYLQDPTKLDKKLYPKTEKVLCVALKHDINRLNDRYNPKSEWYDQEIAQLSTDPLISREIKGGRDGYVCYNCANCGGGLSLKSCPSCGHTFRDDKVHCSSDTPLSQKMIACLKADGFKFAIDPEVALKKEHEDWRASQMLRTS